MKKNKTRGSIVSKVLIAWWTYDYWHLFVCVCESIVKLNLAQQCLYYPRGTTVHVVFASVLHGTPVWER